MDDENRIIAALSYFLFIVTAIPIYFWKKDDGYVRFHAVQSILFTIVIFILAVLLEVGKFVFKLIPVFGMVFTLVLSIASVFFGLGVFLLWLVFMWKAYMGEKWTLPPMKEQVQKYASA